MTANLDELERLHAAASAGRGDHAQGPWDTGSTYPASHARGGTVTFVSTSNTRPVAGITVICESQFPADAAAIAAELRGLRIAVQDISAAAGKVRLGYDGDLPIIIGFAALPSEPTEPVKRACVCSKGHRRLCFFRLEECEAE